MSARYPRPERERRFAVAAPPDLAGAVESHLVEDRYVVGTRLRLRRMTPVGGGPARHKLGHKVRPDQLDSGLVLHTTVPLTAAEYDLLAVLPGVDLRKVRHVLVESGRRLAVDVFEGRLQGLVLLEVELDEGTDGGAFVPPAFAGAEVTGDVRYTGAGLAFATAAQVSALLNARAPDVPPG